MPDSLSAQTRRDDDLRGAVVGRAWMKTTGPAPKEWERGLWGLDAGVSAAVRGGWTTGEILDEVTTLIESYRTSFEEDA